MGEGVLLARRNLHDGPISASTRSELAHNGKRRLQPQHSTEVSPQQHDTDHAAFLSLGCALICWQSLRKTRMTG